MWRILHGDCLSKMTRMAPNTIDAIVTDPPYGLRFMGKDWDCGVPGTVFWQEMLRVAKPGAHLVAFGGTRTHHRLMCAIEDAGWEIRDTLCWLYGSGFPKSLNVSKALEVHIIHGGSNTRRLKTWQRRVFEATTDAAHQWSGWGTALKPAYEPIILARKPLAGTVAANVLAHDTGALNIDRCRISTEDTRRIKTGGDNDFPHGDNAWEPQPAEVGSASGRWPANLLLDEEAAALLGESSRFFYCAKASRSEREAGLEHLATVRRSDGREKDLENPRLRTSARRNNHPTVKPLALMRYLVRLVTPPSGVVLDPFCGSGTTIIAAVLEGFSGTGIDKEASYVSIARARVRYWKEGGE